MPRRKATKAKLKNSENEDPDKSIVADSNNDAALRKEAFMRDFRIQGNLFGTVYEDLYNTAMLFLLIKFCFREKNFENQGMFFCNFSL